MAASAADVRSVLSVPASSSTPAPSQSKKQSTASARKPEGISRELYALIGPSAPSLAAQFTKPRFKQKPNLGSGGKVKWESRPFKNAARSDSLELYHWVPSTSDPEAEYRFAKYNVQSTTYTYSQDEYTRFLEDKEWTKEETDYLFQCVQEYDSRWYVVYDRYEYPGGILRTVDDLKDRYYSVCRKLVRNRPWAGDEVSKAQLLSSLQFDKEREATRKKYVASLENRTPEQIAEEEALFIELKRLEQNERRFKKERDELLRMLLGIESGLPEVAAAVDEEGPMGLSSDNKKRRRATNATADLESPATPSNVISLGPPIQRRAQSAKSLAFDAANCIIRVDPPPATTPATKAAHQPVYLRSFKLPVPKTAVAPKVTAALTELGINHTRLVMPTRENCAQLESLLDATTALVETKKVVDKVDQDIRILKARLSSRSSEGADTGAGTEGATPMDVDEAGDGDADADGDAEGDAERDKNDRAPSVVSTRSGRGRKQNRRSISVSSVDTSATASARAGTKRQRRS